MTTQIILGVITGIFGMTLLLTALYYGFKLKTKKVKYTCPKCGNTRKITLLAWIDASNGKYITADGCEMLTEYILYCNNCGTGFNP